MAEHRTIVVVGATGNQGEFGVLVLSISANSQVTVNKSLTMLRRFRCQDVSKSSTMDGPLLNTQH